MEQQETTNETAANGPVESRGASPILTPAKPLAGVLPAQAAAPPCPTCGAAEVGALARSSYVYALGQIEVRFPRPSVEKEMAQATGRAETAGQTDRQAFYEVLRRPISRGKCAGS